MLTLTVAFIELASSEPAYPKISFSNFLNFAKLAGFITKDETEDF
jgi:hypothetical protein